MMRSLLAAGVLAVAGSTAFAQVSTDPTATDALTTDGATTETGTAAGTGTGTGTDAASDTDTATVIVTTETDSPLDFTSLIPGERITDADIYALELQENEWTGTAAFDAVSADWTVAGEVEELVLDRDGQVAGIVAEIDGGFLGLADRDVFLALEDMRLVPEQLGGDRWAVVTHYSREALQELPEVEGSWYED